MSTRRVNRAKDSSTNLRSTSVVRQQRQTETNNLVDDNGASSSRQSEQRPDRRMCTGPSAEDIIAFVHSKLGKTSLGANGSRSCITRDEQREIDSSASNKENNKINDINEERKRLIDGLVREYTDCKKCKKTGCKCEKRSRSRGYLISKFRAKPQNIEPAQLLDSLAAYTEEERKARCSQRRSKTCPGDQRASSPRNKNINTDTSEKSARRSNDFEERHPVKERQQIESEYQTSQGRKETQDTTRLQNSKLLKLNRILTQLSKVEIFGICLAIILMIGILIFFYIYLDEILYKLDLTSKNIYGFWLQPY